MLFLGPLAVKFCGSEFGHKFMAMFGGSCSNQTDPDSDHSYSGDVYKLIPYYLCGEN